MMIIRQLMDDGRELHSLSTNRLNRKAFPEPDFKYFSNAKAWCLFGN